MYRNTFSKILLAIFKLWFHSAYAIRTRELETGSEHGEECVRTFHTIWIYLDAPSNGVTVERS
jgi:hypothetical protein